MIEIGMTIQIIESALFRMSMKGRQTNFDSSASKKMLQDWIEKIVRKFKAQKKRNSIIVGKYLKLRDAYKSLFEALEHASFQQGLKLKIVNCRP